MRRAQRRTLLLALLAACLAAFALPLASAQGEEGEGGAAWRLEQPSPPLPPPGVESATCGEPGRSEGKCVPIGLGHVGDLEFWAPNRGLLTTQGNGSTIAAGLWAYNGQRWHQLSNVCGATDGRIGWAGPEEFWTISDGRPGQAGNPKTGLPAPLEDNTLCHFAHGEVVASYASPAFQANSYQPMHALDCLSTSDCWFAGDPLPELQNGESFHLHWNGGALTAEPTQQGHAVEDMRKFGGALYESVRLVRGDREAEPEFPFPFALHLINPKGVTPQVETVPGVPLYSSDELPQALDFLHLSAGEDELWAAAGSVHEPPEGKAAPLTVVRNAEGLWGQVLGSGSTIATAINEDVVKSIAAEPGTESAWLALDTQQDAFQPSPNATALVAHVTADGTVETTTLPSASEIAQGVGPKGAAASIACPAFQDCWMVTTQGWIFHLAPEGERTRPLDNSSAFASLITHRPEDEGVPKTVSDAPPPDTSGLTEGQIAKPGLIEIPTANESKVRAPLLTNLHSRLVHGTTLELRFKLAVKARVKLIAKRKKKIVASTPVRTFSSGSRKLLLALNRNRWPTKLDLQTHALEPLPLVSTRLPGNNTVGTSFARLPSVPSFGGSPQLAAPIAGVLP